MGKVNLHTRWIFVHYIRERWNFTYNTFTISYWLKNSVKPISRYKIALKAGVVHLAQLLKRIPQGVRKAISAHKYFLFRIAFLRVYPIY